MEYNCRVYDYPAGQHVSIYRRTITRNEKHAPPDTEPDTEAEAASETDTVTAVTADKDGMPQTIPDGFTKTNQDPDRSPEAEEHSRKVSLASTKNRLYNIARSNTWQWFITLTFDQKETDSSDYTAVVKRLQKFLNNLQQRTCPDLKYLIVPELHKDGIHYHFHGLLADCDGLQFSYSGHSTEDGEPVYNILNWKHGFTTATQITDTRRACSYITKYITKESQIFLKEKNRYYASRNVNRTDPDFHIVDQEDFLKVYGDRIQYVKSEKIPAAYQQVNYYELDY